ncbi:Holliday junction branch migration protein RuvA [Brevibacillus humidisoli]|uniref:Holliday junction branch migration protein RuvA n=1 Tax=Brevibacillus humidisoli TaxID=2895522 RepID=UPI001E2B9FB9|nr:Holliday junction branch migration protein RuvA [Brevibacillus humidisoli]UFJ39024.1 Holliday junction branch migration protein RuvA [Brevibacillus humidisoli]
MIDFVEGTIDYIENDYVVVAAGGVGYRLFCPNPYAFISEQGQVKRLYTHQHVREDALHLYGFAARDERDLFRRLLDVSGLGPKGALAILAAAKPEQIVGAIQQENVQYLTSFPGIGKKTAQRMILDLKDKLKGAAAASFLPESAVGEQQEAGNALREALDALGALGYTEAELQRIRQTLMDHVQGGAGVEQLIKQGLALLVRG